MTSLSRCFLWFSYSTILRNVPTNKQRLIIPIPSKAWLYTKKVDIYTYTEELDKLAKLGTKESANQAEQLLRELEQRSRYHPNLTPNTVTYNTVLHALAKCGEAHRAEQILRRMEQLFNKNHVQPDVITYTTVIYAYANSTLPNSAVRAEQLFFEMERKAEEEDQKQRQDRTNNSQSKSNSSSSVTPNTRTYNMVLSAIAKRGTPERAHQILCHMMNKYRNGHPVKPNTTSFTIVMDAWARNVGDKNNSSPKTDSTQYVEQLFHEMKQWDNCQPNIVTYNTLIHVFAQHGHAQRAEHILQTMLLPQQPTTSTPAVIPNTISFTTVIEAWANSGDPQGPMKAEYWLQQMEHIYHTLPDVWTYNAVFHAYYYATYGSTSRNGKTTKKDDSTRMMLSRVEELLAEMEYRSRKERSLKPNTATYNTVIHILAKYGAAQRAEHVLQTMIDRYHHQQQQQIRNHTSNVNEIDNITPNTISFTSVMDAWAKSGDSRGPSRSEQILRQMEDMYRFGNPDVQPDSVAYNTVINAYAKSNQKGAVAHAERILAEMEQRQRGEVDNSHPLVKPDRITYNTVLHALAKSGEPHAAERAEAMLQTMVNHYHNGDKSLQPNTISFNSVINAWARSGDSRGPSRAEQIMRTMEELYTKLGNQDLCPNTKTFTTVIHSYAKSTEKGSGFRAEQLLAEMERRSLKESHLKPDTVTYTTVIHAIAKRGERDAAKRAERILTLMQNQHDEGNNVVKPNAHTYNTVINACALTKRHEEYANAFDIAFRVFHQMTVKNVKPDAVTYSSLLNVCRNLLPRKDVERRYMVAKSLLEECCAAGYVNDYVLNALRQTVSEDQYIELVGSLEKSSHHLPRHWTRNIVNQKFS